MTAVQLLTGRGGWPMSVFLTPDLQPFYAGTYFPPTSRGGMPGFDQVIHAVGEAWRNRREQVIQQAGELTEHVRRATTVAAPGEIGGPELLHAALGRLEQQFDYSHGGFGGAPKFPHAMDLQLLLRLWRRDPRDAVLAMVRLSLDKMAQGGIYDHLGGGFARYSVDARWLVPHFEKMLYDNALLAATYVDGYLATGEARYATVARETLDYVLRDMTDETGGFHSAEDADSEGEEGKFYVWTPDQVEQVLGAELAARFCLVYDVTPDGNFEGKSILNLPKTLSQVASLRNWPVELVAQQMADARHRLLEARQQRVRPGKDHKVLVSWNGLMIDALARAAAALDEPRYLLAAQRTGHFLWDHCRRPNGRLLHSWCAGRARFEAYLDDYACLANALVTLYETDFDEQWIDRAVELAELMRTQFEDPQQGGFFFTAHDHEPLLTRNKDLQDASVPSGNSMAATVLIRLGRLCGRDDFLESAGRTLQAAAQVLQTMPAAAGQMLIALELWLGPWREIAVVGDPASREVADVVASLRQRFVPNRVLACRPEPTRGPSRHLDPLFRGKEPAAEPPQVYVCQNFTCQAPVSGRREVLRLWDRLSGADPSA